MASKNTETVKVAVRCRPLSPVEIQDQRQMIISVNPSRGEIVVKNPKADSSEPPKTFTFDLVYDWNSKQETIYNETAYPIVESVLEGYNGTIFAYGQTGTGKTHTMEGVAEKPDLRGIIPRAFEHVFKSIQSTTGKQFLIRCSFLELYNEEIRDLLARNPKNKLELREKPDSGVYVKDLSSFHIQNAEEMAVKLSDGRKSRAVGATNMNRDSSRSHSIFTIIVECSEYGKDGQNHIRMGKLNLVDLAGSERQSKTHAEGDRFKEAVNINQSLSTLGNVISALVDPKSSHIPYRDSKLTRLLQDSLGGNTKTVMIANIGPADWNFDETLSTLRYANRAKSIKNKPKINEDPKDTMLREYQEEIMKLRQQLMSLQAGGNVDLGSLMMDGQTEVVEKVITVNNSEKIKEIQEKIAKEKEAIRMKAEEERKQIEQQKHLAEEKKQQLLQALKEKEEAEHQARENQENMLKKLKNMEEKLIVGNKAMEQAMKQEKELQKARLELEEKRIQERRLAEELAAKEDAKLMMEKKFSSQNEELEDKKKKLQKLYNKYQEVKSEIQDQVDEFNREREAFADQIRELQRQLLLREAIIASFVPEEEVMKVESRAQWNNEIDDWVLPHLQLSETSLRKKRPDSALGLKRPVSEYARMAKNFGESNPRYKYDNILQLELDMPERTTEDYEGTTISQRLQNTINTALNEDEDETSVIHNEGQPNIYLEFLDFGSDAPVKEEAKDTTAERRQPVIRGGPVKRPMSGMRRADPNDQSMVSTTSQSTTATKMGSISDVDNFPKAKGLVKKR